MSLTSLHEATISMISLLNEVDVLLHDYQKIEGAPKAVEDTLTDIKYMKDTLNDLEILFGDKKHTLHVPEEMYVESSIQLELRSTWLTSTRMESFNAIRVPLQFDLHELHKVLQKWPQSSTIWAIVTFGCKHTAEVTQLRERIVEHQLRFTVIFSSASFLPGGILEGDQDYSIAESTESKLIDTEELIAKTDARIGHGRNTHLPLFVEIEHREHEEPPHPNHQWSEVLNSLRALPPVLRLSHLVGKLEEILNLANEANLPQYSAFGSDLAVVLGGARKLDERLTRQENFSDDVKKEM